jgi:hypothetical protein
VFQRVFAEDRAPMAAFPIQHAASLTEFSVRRLIVVLFGTVSFGNAT